MAQTVATKLLLFVLAAIYNYNPRGEQELRLQVGDAVHILEKLEGKGGPRRGRSAPLAPLTGFPVCPQVGTGVTRCATNPTR